MTTNKNQPTNRLRCGNIKATIWQNVSDKGPSSQRPSPARSRISPARGVMGPHSVSMTLRRLSPSRVMPRSGSPLTLWSAKPLQWEASGLPGASLEPSTLPLVCYEHWKDDSLGNLMPREFAERAVTTGPQKVSEAAKFQHAMVQFPARSHQETFLGS
jgi:hypothetical protein